MLVYGLTIHQQKYFYARERERERELTHNETRADILKDWSYSISEVSEFF